MYRRADGIVDFDKTICIGCKACIAACPYDAIFINPEDHSAEKCNFCAHRLDVGLEPACVVVCPTEAILVGDLADPVSRVAQVVGRDAVTVRRPEKDTKPKLFYKGAHQATLDPIAAKRPAGGIFMWSEQGRLPDQVPSGHPSGWSSSAAAVLAYDVPHRAPWDWRVSLYTWTKGVAAGVYLLAVTLAALGILGWDGVLWRLAVPVLGGFSLALTGALLVWDLEHPERFHYIFLRPQWRSWLVRGGFIIGAYALVLIAHFAAALAHAFDVMRMLAVAGVPLALATAVYTAWLFAQAKARDLWQNPLAPFHLAVQAVVLGAAALCAVAREFEPAAVSALLRVLAGSAALHLLLVLGENTLTHGTTHARLAAWEMTRGRFGAWFWVAAFLLLVGCAAPWIGPLAAAPALIGLLAYEHAYVQAGQAVPLA
jgi:formate-dependent nitrite reductase membrane component NrfD/ferredoxin